MAKTSKREPLVVGQRIWLEELPWFHSHDDVRTATEFEIVKANGTSSYAVRIDRLDDFNNGERVSDVKIAQGTRKGTNTVSRFLVWSSKEEFQNDINSTNEIKELRAKAIHLVKQMNADELRKVLEI